MHGATIETLSADYSFTYLQRPDVGLCKNSIGHFTNTLVNYWLVENILEWNTLSFITLYWIVMVR